MTKWTVTTAAGAMPRGEIPHGDTDTMSRGGSASLAATRATVRGCARGRGENMLKVPCAPL